MYNIYIYRLVVHGATAAQTIMTIVLIILRLGFTTIS